MQSAVFYDTRMIKKRKNMVTVRLLVAIKDKKKTSQDIDCQKKYQNFETRHVRHTIPLTISIATTV